MLVRTILLGISGVWHGIEAIFQQGFWGVTGGPPAYQGLPCGSDSSYFEASGKHPTPNSSRSYWKREYDQSDIKVNVLVSVIAGGPNTSKFDRSTAETWIKLLNGAFGKYHVFFYLFEFQVIQNRKLSYDYPGMEDPLNLFGNKDHKTLHLVVAEKVTSREDSETLRGIASFPWDFTPGVAQGVFLKAEAMPPFQYSSLPHEVGHWMGLLHTFNNGCPDVPLEHLDRSHHSDYVLDTVIANDFQQTPPESGGCPAKDIPSSALCELKTKSRKESVVFENYPVFNYMSYTAPDCRSEFTPGQGRRIRAMWAWREHGNGPKQETLY
jgi:hypothetical protein